MLTFLKRNREVAAAATSAIVLVALVVGAAFQAFGRLENAGEARKDAFILVGAVGSVMSSLRAAESAQRGYLLTNDETFASAQAAETAAVKHGVAELLALDAGDRGRETLAAVVPLIEAKLVEMTQVTALQRAGGSVGALALVQQGNGKRLMESITQQLQFYAEVEGADLLQKRLDFLSSMRGLLSLLVVGTLLIVLLAASFVYASLREVRYRVDSELAARGRSLLEEQTAAHTRLRVVNEALELSKEQLTVTLKSIGDAVLATDADGRVTMLNAVAEKLTGWTLAEASGHLVDDVFHIVNEATRERSAIPVAQTLIRGTIHGLANHTVLIARGGVETPIADSCAPIRTRAGDVIGAVLVFRDVSAEHASSQSIRDLQIYTRSLIESNTDAIITTDAAGTITDINAPFELLTGKPRNALVGKSLADQFTAPVRAQSALARAFANDAIKDFDLLVPRPDGSQISVSCNMNPFHDADKALKGVFFTARDVTDRKRVDEQLAQTATALEATKTLAEKASQAKSEFLSGMSHELRSPLNAILGFAQLMESAVPAPSPSQQVSLAQILKAGWHLLTLINEVLDLAVVESGKMSVSLEPVSLAEVLGECEAMMSPQARDRKIELAFPHVPPGTVVQADRTRLKQVLINLLSNAIKYNNIRGSVVLTCTQVGLDRTRISIIDTGAGLLPEQRQRLFEPFNRLGQEGGTEEGTGIGLVMSKRLVELMGGAIGVESKIGDGSVFWFELPTAMAPQHVVASSAVADDVGNRQLHNVAHRSLLYVEDNAANLQLVIQILARRQEIRVTSATSGRAGIELARSSRPEVILMDINLPGMSGLEALSVLLHDKATADIPVIAISANAMPRDVKAGLDAGFFRYITKPIKVVEFLAVVDEALALASSRKQPVTLPTSQPLPIAAKRPV